MLRVLVTHERFFPDFAGGCEYGVYSLARALQSRGAAVRVLTTGDPAKKQYNGIETLRLPIHRYRMNLAKRRIASEARDVDLIQTANYHAALASYRAARSLGKPIVLLVTALCGPAWLEMRGPVAGRAYAAWERYLMRLPFSRIVFPSEHALEMGLAMGVVRERCVVIPPGIEHGRFRPPHERRQPRPILFVGKFERRKGVYDVLETARLLPEIPFRLMGWGPEEQKLRSLAPPNATIQSIPAGDMMEKEPRLPQAFADASIFFLPSRAESFGLVLVEAMASGCAIVSTLPLDFEGARAEAGNTPKMAEAIRKLWSDPARVRAMGRRNIEIASGYHWDRFTTALLEVYEDILDRRPTEEHCHVS